MNVPCRLFFCPFHSWACPGLPIRIEVTGLNKWATHHIGLWVGTWKGFRAAPKGRLSKKQLGACNCNVGFEQMTREDECRVQRKKSMSWLSRSHAVRGDAPVISVTVSVYRLLSHQVFGGLVCSALSQSNPSFRISGVRSSCLGWL